MNLASAVIMAALGLAVIGIIVSIVKKRKTGCSKCSCCSLKCQCNNKK